MRLLILVLLFVGFSAWTLTIVFEHGLFGFITLSLREPWAMQMLADLFLSLFIGLSFIKRDAKERGLPYWPYVAFAATCGSPGVLAYLVHREIAARKSGHRHSS